MPALSTWAVLRDGTGCYLAEQPKIEFCGQIPEKLLSQAVDLVLIK